MKCPNCGKEIAEDSKFCEYCGTKVHVEKPSKITLDPENKVWLGVCAGEGKYNAMRWGGNPKTWTIISRISFVVLTCIWGAGILVYLLAYLFYKNNK